MNPINTTIGKFALDSLTIGMYENKMVLFREYIQNSTDAIDKAVNELKCLESIGDSQIDIILDNKKNLIKIIDNGSGIKKDEVISTLCDIGNSRKDYSTNRGFRGIGRLAGTAYCEKLIFTTSYKGESEKSTLIWDCIKLKELLKPGQYVDMDLKQVIEKCVRIEYEDELEESHYFEVKLDGVDKNSELLNTQKVKDYLVQVLPIEMNSVKFYYYSDLNEGIKKYMRDNNVPIEEYPIEFNGEKLTKLYSASKLKTNKENQPDEIIGVHKHIIKDNQDNIVAFLWYGERKNLIGQLSDDRISGLRYRKNNIMVGDFNTVSKLFSEGRFNKYYIGEIYIIDNLIIPNARRDDFEDNDAYRYLKCKLVEYFKKISSEIRPMSDLKNAEKKITNNNDKIQKLKKQLSNKLPKDEASRINQQIIELQEDNEKQHNKKKKSEKKLIEVGRTDIKNDECINTFDKKKKLKEIEVTKKIDGINNTKQEKVIDPLKGKSREVKKTIRFILKLLKKNLDESKYEEIEKLILESI